MLELHTLKQTNQQTEAELAALKEEHVSLREKHEKLTAESTNTINGTIVKILCGA